MIVTNKLGISETNKILNKLLKVDAQNIRLRTDPERISLIQEKVAEYFCIEIKQIRTGTGGFNRVSDAKIVTYALIKQFVKRTEVKEIAKAMGNKSRHSYHNALRKFNEALMYENDIKKAYEAIKIDIEITLQQ